MKEEKAVAIMMGNLKGSKIKPTNLLEFAVACRELKNKWGFTEMAKHFRVSQYMLRQIDKINELTNPKIKKLIKDGKLGIEASYQLWRIKEPKRSQVADEIKDMTIEDVRTLMYILKKNPELSVQECKKIFKKSEPEKMRLLVLPLDPETYEHLQKSALKSKETIHNYSLKILRRDILGKKS